MVKQANTLQILSNKIWRSEMIVNRYGGKTNINFGEDPLYLYIVWQCAGLVKKIVDTEKNERIEKWFSDKQEYHRVNKISGCDIES